MTRLPPFLAHAHPSVRGLAIQAVDQARFGTIGQYRKALIGLARKEPARTADVITMLAWMCAINTYPETTTEIQRYEAWMVRMHTEYNRLAKTPERRSTECRVGESVYSRTVQAARKLRRRAEIKAERKNEKERTA